MAANMQLPGETRQKEVNSRAHPWRVHIGLAGSLPLKGLHQGRHIVAGAGPQRLGHHGVGRCLRRLVCRQGRGAGQ